MSTQEPLEETDHNSFICACEEHLRQACASEGFYKEKEGKHYCVLHYPGDEKVVAFQRSINRKQSAKDYNFSGVWFPKGVSFKELYLDGTANFSSASFNEYIDFSGVEFKVKALFNNASFNAGVDFRRTIFSADSDFSGASFDECAHFNEADFHYSTDFREARFTSSVDFSRAIFKETANFFKASFGLSASFISANFGGEAVFDSASFSSDADFSSATFIARAEFINAKFFAKAEFINAKFFAVANFTQTTFRAAAYFHNATFSALASFRNASFSKDADFGLAIFSKDANFINATFSLDANFINARFSLDAFFKDATFSAVTDFTYASFSGVADFSATIISADAFFKAAIFKDYVYFGGQPKRKAFGDQTQLTFHSAIFEKPDRISFHTLDLKPHWFVEVDTRKFVFTDVEFNCDLKGGLESLKKAYVNAPHRLLAIACRQLAVNAEENHRYRQAADLRYASMNAERLEWRQDRKINKFQFLRWLYWIASGYGERVTRAFWVLVVLWLLFAFLYMRVGFEHKTNKPGNDQQSIAVQVDEVGKPLPLKKVLTYSLGVMSLQKPDPKPVTIAAQILVLLESILGPLQAALLALAIRRRFMR